MMINLISLLTLNLNARFKRTIQTYERVAKQNDFVFVTAIFSYTGEMHEGSIRLILGIKTEIAISRW